MGGVTLIAIGGYLLHRIHAGALSGAAFFLGRQSTLRRAVAGAMPPAPAPQALQDGPGHNGRPRVRVVELPLGPPAEIGVVLSGESTAPLPVRINPQTMRLVIGAMVGGSIAAAFFWASTLGADRSTDTGIRAAGLVLGALAFGLHWWSFSSGQIANARVFLEAVEKLVGLTIAPGEQFAWITLTG